MENSVLSNNQNNQNNNIEVVTTAFHDGLLKQCKLYQNVVFGAINIISIKRKDEIMSEVIKDENLFVLFLTETWLKWKMMMTTYGRKLHAFKWITTMIYIVWIDHLIIGWRTGIAYQERM